MPKSASAGHSQALQCALAIVASLADREAPPALFESVCYSLVAPGSALSIHGRFNPADGVMQQLDVPDQAASGPSSVEATNADNWYKNIVREAFGI
jgi:sulfide dehydrogenase [flavocytochrome c] flavoprotein subunit